MAADGGYRITGSKIFITHAGVGEIFVVTARTGRVEGHRGITSFVVCKPTVDLDDATRDEALGRLDQDLSDRIEEIEDAAALRLSEEHERLNEQTSQRFAVQPA